MTPLAVTFLTATEMTGVGRSRLYDLIRMGVLDARKSGRRTLLLTASLERYVASLPPAKIGKHEQAA